MPIARVIAPESVTAAAAAVQRAITIDESLAGEQMALHPEAGGYRRAAAPGRRVCRSALKDLAFMHDQDLVSYPGDHRQIMADEDERVAPNLALFQQSQHLCLHSDVESRGRPVGDQDAWIDSVEQNFGTS